MNNQPRLTAFLKRNGGAFKIAGIYLLAGVLWITFSDLLAAGVAADASMFAKISTYKGWGFVFATAILLFLMIRRYSDTLHREGEQLRLAQAEHRQASDELRQWADAFDGCAHGIAIIAPDTSRITVCNPAFAGMHRCRVEDMVGSSILSLFPPQAQEFAKRNIEKADHIGQSRFDSQMIRKDGSNFPVQVDVASVRGNDGFILRRVISAQNITERKRAEATIHHKDELLRMTSEMAKVGGWEFDPATGKGTWTDEVARIHDMDPEAETNVELGISVYLGESRRRIEEAVRQAVESAKPYDLELEMRTFKGEHKWVRTMALPILEDGRVVRVQGIFQDITERKKAEEEIRRLNADLEQRVAERTAQLEAANKELEAFSYSVSHDLRAPLRAIGGFTRILVEDYAPSLDEEGKRVCGIISAEAERMGQLIDDLLAFSRLSRKEMRMTVIDMKGMAESVLDELTRDGGRERIDIRVGNLPPARGDPALMRQVWINLLSNAVKFTSGRKRAMLEVGGSQNERENVYSVRDNGAGFDMEYVGKLFGVFQRLHSENEFEGTGVGLAIVQRVIHRHGGRVWAEGEVGKGATFHFSLPHKEAGHG